MRGLEVGPELQLGLALVLRDVLEVQEDRTVGEIRTDHDVFDAVEDHRTHGIEQSLVLIGIKLSGGKAAAGGEATQSVGNPIRHARYVIESKQVRVVRR